MAVGPFGFKEYGQGKGQVHYKAILPDGRYAELNVWNEGREDESWKADAPFLEDPDKTVPFEIAERLHYFLDEIHTGGFLPEEYEEEVVEILTRWKLWLDEK